MCKISIIIPVYNVAEYLNDVLNSILEQTFEDFEVICINDGSTDNSLEILETFTTKDHRFKVISQPNQGQGVARNNGITLAKGEYLMFVDPDDYIEKNSLEIIYNKFQQTNVDVIQFDYTRIKEDGELIEPISFSQKIKKEFKYSIKDNETYDWHDIKKRSLTGLSLTGWDKAYRTDFIKKNNIKFAPNKCGEDHIFSISANLLAEKILYIEKSLYYYRTRKDSAVNKASVNNFCIFENISLLKEFLISNNLYKEFEKAFIDYETSVLSWHYGNIPQDKVDEYKNKSKKLLSKKDYKVFLAKAKGDFSFLEKLFSLKNLVKNNTKIKCVTILGLTFSIKSRRKVTV